MSEAHVWWLSTKTFFAILHKSSSLLYTSGNLWRAISTSLEMDMHNTVCDLIHLKANSKKKNSWHRLV